MTVMDRSELLRRNEWLTRVRPVELAELFKRVLRVRRCEVDADGMRVWVDPASNFGKRILRDGTYEREMTAALRALLSNDAVFVDIGANEGWFSLEAARLVGPKGKVLACEPQERLWPVILKNAALNSFINIQLLPFAVAAQNGYGVINLYPSTNTGSSHIGGATRRWEKAQTTKLVPLSSILDIVGCPVDLIKIDVEGYEMEVLRSAGAHLGSSIMKLVVEVHPGPLKTLGSSAEEVGQYLWDHGYHMRVVESVAVWELEQLR